MEPLQRPATTELPEKMLSGDAWADVVYRGEDPSRARANVVRFAPGARTTWHSHGLGQRAARTPRPAGSADRAVLRQ
ncbi:hypothetical protein [Actinomadura rugatobispora]|uniref:Cupin domain-containing protein n=1 Tax=Actinomadura rugatobispora TaxID=1994 RepID=A0ABW0ZRZ1_9ACTN|nr:hypothetical protein GCM10010200_101470 [Actinomadura rugatobispora]